MTRKLLPEELQQTPKVTKQKSMFSQKSVYTYIWVCIYLYTHGKWDLKSLGWSHAVIAFSAILSWVCPPALFVYWTLSFLLNKLCRASRRGTRASLTLAAQLPDPNTVCFNCYSAEPSTSEGWVETRTEELTCSRCNLTQKSSQQNSVTTLCEDLTITEVISNHLQAIRSIITT